VRFLATTIVTLLPPPLARSLARSVVTTRPADPDETFVFPDDTWYLQKLPVLYQRDAATYKAHHVPLVNLATAIQELVMKLAVRFTENESGHSQRASIISVVNRYLSSSGEAPSVDERAQATAGVMVSRRHDDEEGGGGESSGSGVSKAPALNIRKWSVGSKNKVQPAGAQVTAHEQLIPGQVAGD
jgi:hypothetical protein